MTKPSEGEGKPKAVLDTNVLVSGLLFDTGAPREILDNATDFEFIAVVSLHILKELEEVLLEDFGFSKSEAEQTAGLLKLLCIIAEPKEIPKVVASDPDDDNLFAAAICGNAKIIVSGDKKVRAIKRFGDIDVYSPKEFLEMLEK